MSVLPLALTLIGNPAGATNIDTEFIVACQTIGHPFSALLICTLMSMHFPGKRLGLTGKQLQEVANAALEPAGMIILVIGASRVLKQVLIYSRIGERAADATAAVSVGPILQSFSLAAIMRLLKGSGSVAIVSEAGLVAAKVPQNKLPPKLLD